MSPKSLTLGLLIELANVADSVLGGEGFNASWCRDGDLLRATLVEAAEEINLWFTDAGELKKMQWTWGLVTDGNIPSDIPRGQRGIAAALWDGFDAALTRFY